MMNQYQQDNYHLLRFRQEIELMKDAIDAYQRKIAKPHVVEKLSKECRGRIYNAATYIGDFATAYEYAGNAEEAKLVVRLARALTRGESETCKCPIETITSPGSPVELPRFFNWRRIYDQERAVWVDIYKCSMCNFMTAHPNATCSHSARNLDRLRSKKRGEKNPMKDHEALRQ